MSSDTVGILGGTGAQGSGLALRLAAAGVPITIGSRSAERAAAKARELSARASGIAGAANDEVAAGADTVVVAVPFAEAQALLRGLQGRWRSGVVVVDVTVPLDWRPEGPRLVMTAEGSGSAGLAAVLPEGVSLVGAAKTLPAGLLRRLDLPLDCDEFVYGEDLPARRRVIDLLGRIPGLRPIDAGGLAVATTVERMALLAIELNRRHGVRHCRYRVAGL